MSDLDRELEEWQREREKKKGRRAEGPSDVLTDIAEEFLEFLEMGAGLGVAAAEGRPAAAAPLPCAGTLNEKLRRAACSPRAPNPSGNTRASG